MIRTLRVTVNGHEYDVTVEDRTDPGTSFYPQPGSMVMPSPPSAPPPSRESAGTAPAGGGAAVPPPPATAAGVQPALATGAVLAPMSGVLVEILVTQGQQVSDGETVAIIEAMKMKTPLVVEQGGTVASIDAAVGDGVQVGQQILSIS
ncbi:biotin/lipoyl-containing protein [Granulicoccus sp. GXG6511]|uniref:acetyl-CoA carboxylase biotin carboxyl carrier protein subunit n=1 Tax=Granulicoccus sp. GXG6511 TaxID=3381351 RepID=UPI003D7F078F